MTCCLFPPDVGNTVSACLESAYSCLFHMSHSYVLQLVKRVYKGIPLQLRGQAWALLLDVEKVRTENEGKYEV